VHYVLNIETEIFTWQPFRLFIINVGSSHMHWPANWLFVFESNMNQIGHCNLNLNLNANHKFKLTLKSNWLEMCGITDSSFQFSNCRVYTVPQRTINGSNHLTTMSKGQAVLLQNFSDWPITFKWNWNGWFEFESNSVASQVPTRTNWKAVVWFWFFFTKCVLGRLSLVSLW